MSQGPTVQVRFHRLAAQEYIRAFGWYARRSPGAAQRFRDALDEAVRRIAGAPQSWPIFRGPYRWVRAGRFPYILYYRLVSSTDILILAVAHQRRRPGYWVRRSLP
jgi:plasmid stabilization system protein ParE